METYKYALYHWKDAIVVVAGCQEWVAFLCTEKEKNEDKKKYNKINIQFKRATMMIVDGTIQAKPFFRLFQCFYNVCMHNAHSIEHYTYLTKI